MEDVGLWSLLGALEGPEELRPQGCAAVAVTARALCLELPVLLLETRTGAADHCGELVHFALRANTPPAIVIVDTSCDRALAARLALVGVTEYMDTPLCQAQLLETAPRLGNRVQVFKQAARSLVGRAGLKEAQGDLRALMRREAVDRLSGSCQAAAGVLEVDRRYVARLSLRPRPAM